MPLSQLTIPVQCQELPCLSGDFHFKLLYIYAWRCHYDVIIGPTWIPARQPSSDPQHTRCLHYFVISFLYVTVHMHTCSNTFVHLQRTENDITFLLAIATLEYTDL